MASYDVLKADYEAIRADHSDLDLKPYDELSDKERAQHAASYAKLAEFMRGVGRAINEGGPLPDPMEMLE